MDVLLIFQGHYRLQRGVAVLDYCVYDVMSCLPRKLNIEDEMASLVRSLKSRSSQVFTLATVHEGVACVALSCWLCSEQRGGGRQMKTKEVA